MRSLLFAEMAMVSVNKSKIKMLAEKGNKKALLLKKVLKSPGNFLSTIQIGITFAGFLPVHQRPLAFQKL